MYVATSRDFIDGGLIGLAEWYDKITWCGRWITNQLRVLVGGKQISGDWCFVMLENKNSAFAFITKVFKFKMILVKLEESMDSEIISIHADHKFLPANIF